MYKFPGSENPVTASSTARRTSSTAGAFEGSALKRSPRLRAPAKWRLTATSICRNELIIEYLNYKGRKSDEIWAEIEAQNPGDPGGQLYGFVDKAATFIAGDERGCDLANAAIELTEQGHPGLRVIEEFKMRQRERLTNLCLGRRRLPVGASCRHAVSLDRRRARQSPQRRNQWPQRQSRTHQPRRHRVIRRPASRGPPVDAGA